MCLIFAETLQFGVLQLSGSCSQPEGRDSEEPYNRSVLQLEEVVPSRWIGIVGSVSGKILLGLSFF